MAVSSVLAARKVCELAGWTLSNLSLQKILYFAHMLHLGRHGEPLVGESFEAWDYGPVLPSVYHRAKVFGSSPVRNVFHVNDDHMDGDALETLEEAVRALSDQPAGKLVAITHWEDGAWAKHYPGGRNKLIPNSDIQEEYHDRVGR